MLELQLQLDDAKVSLEVAKDAVSRSGQNVRKLEMQEPLKKDLGSFQTRAKSSGLRFVTLKGLHHWSPIRLEAKMLAFAFTGCCSKTCVVTTFEFSEIDFTRFSSAIDKSWCTQDGRHREVDFDRQLSTVVEHKMNFLLKSKGEGVLLSHRDMGYVLQQLEWKLSRVELMAIELARLRQMPGVQMSFEREDEGVVSVRIALSSPSLGQRVRATFILDDTYPMSPPHVLTLDSRGGTVDLDELDCVLKVKVRPGFDLLSRICKEIVTFLGRK